ncbi:diguanylate cyclase domain-containing protein [Jeotgalibaca porci]|uniref:diguanylate cyclase domain-containing protein n=1 Tax=Jeotgalibaca porci TaxID=1868793 RepID=UPI003F8E65CE
MKRKIGSLVISVLVAFLISIPVFILEREHAKEHSKDLRAQESRELTRIKDVMQADLQSALNYAHFLELIIQQDTDFTVEEFQLYAEMIIAENDFVTSAVLAPDGVVAFIYPITPQNDQFLGQDLLSEPEQRLSTQYAVKNRTAVVQGPFEENGTLMVYNRQPVFIDDTFYGFVSIGVNFYQLLEARDIEDKSGDILLALQVTSEINPRSAAVRWGNVSIFDKDPEINKLELSGEEWVFAAYPRDGWDKPNISYYPEKSAFFFIWVVSSFLLYLLLNTCWKHREDAYHDGLTQTLNKKCFEKYVRTRLKNKKSRDTLLLIDIDGFKLINDKYGHAVGDYVLIVISDRLRKFVRKTDKVGRIGGDEFMVYLQDIATPEHVEALIEKLREKISYPIEYQNHTISISVSIGWAVAHAGTAFEQIYARADEAMYQQKCQGKA